MRNSLFGKLDLRLAAPDPAGCRVEPDVAGLEDGVERLGRAAGEGPQAGRQLGEGERLDQVVVGAGVEPGDAVGHGVARGQEQDRGLHAPAAQPAADLEPVDAGQHDVEDDRVVGGDGDPVERLFAAAGEVDGVALLGQPAAEQAGQPRLVFDHQDAHGNEAPGQLGQSKMQSTITT